MSKLSNNNETGCLQVLITMAIFISPIPIAYYTDIDMVWFGFLFLMIFGLMFLVVSTSYDINSKSYREKNGGCLSIVLGLILWFAGGFGFHYYYNFFGIKSLLLISIILIVLLILSASFISGISEYNRRNNR